MTLSVVECVVCVEHSCVDYYYYTCYSCDGMDCTPVFVELVMSCGPTRDKASDDDVIYN